MTPVPPRESTRKQNLWLMLTGLAGGGVIGMLGLRSAEAHESYTGVGMGSLGDIALFGAFAMVAGLPGLVLTVFRKTRPLGLTLCALALGIIIVLSTWF